MTERTGPRLDADRRAALNAAKLAALVAGRWGAGARERHALGLAAALLGPPAPPAAERADQQAGPAGRSAWVLADAAPDRALGPALVWADRHQVDDLHVIADVDAPGSALARGGGAGGADGAAAAIGTLARQAGLFAPPQPTVWRVDGTALVAADAAPVPARVEAPAPPELVDLLIDAGLEIVVEGGMVRGEVNGLEVARIVEGQTTAGVPIEAPQLEVGVGKADRELTAMVHGDLPPVDQLGRVVEIARQHRQPGAPRHPLNQLVPDRWLRAVLCRAPALVGLASLRPAEGTRPRPNLSERDAAIAAGLDSEGVPVVVACSVGIALDLVPTAADAREAIDPAARLLLAVPERDDHPTIRRLAARLRSPAEVAPIPGDWRAAAA
ncbi:MAG TPA: hypothetical protein VK360_05795 [Acidimicrobiales bacterium]|nr:hypothetical protein [Acidimicrobiales bacterium]